MREKFSSERQQSKACTCVLPGARTCKRIRRPGINSGDSIPPAYVAWRAGTTNRVGVPARQVGNRFLGSFIGLQIRARARHA
jgi:hypothetical protein